MYMMDKRWKLMITLLAWIIYLLQVTVVAAQDTNQQNTWYVGCYQKPADMTPLPRDFWVDHSRLDPVQCSRQCLTLRKQFALLDPPNCICLTSISDLQEVPQHECNQSCPSDIASMCGGVGVSSVFSSQGPFILEVRLAVFAPKTLVGQPVNVTVPITLGAPPGFETGLDRYAGKDMSMVNVTIGFPRTSLSFSTRIEPGQTTTTLQFLYTPEAAGYQNFDVLIRNAMSSFEYRDFIEVLSPVLASLSVVVDASRNMGSGPCVPNATEFADYNNLDIQEHHNAVSIGVETTFRAYLFSGVNVTFEWNICNIRLIRYRNENCSFCRENKQASAD
ncbi:uncharacterized protein LOC144746854 [Ciona intestinalis]